MVHSEVVTDNVETVLLGFIGQTYCTLCCRMTSAPRLSSPRLPSPYLSVSLFSLSDGDVGIYRLKYLFLHKWEQRFLIFC